MDLSGKVAVITGGASGIGLATARHFAGLGARLVLGDIEPGPLDEAVRDLRTGGAGVVGVTCDVSVEDDVIALREAALAEFGGAHLVFNNAGVGGGATIGTPLPLWRWVLDVNVIGVVNGINAFAPHFLAQNEGHIVNTASLAGLGGVPGMGPYCASKFAVVGISESLHHELALLGSAVKVSCLCPGFVRTRIFDAMRNLPPELRPYVPERAEREERTESAAVVNAGIDASEVAAAVARAVADGSFWILTHERSAIRTTERRVEWMKGGRATTIDLAAATKADRAD